MNRLKQTTVNGAREYFSEELKTVMERHHVEAKDHSFEYLVDLMVRYMQSDHFFVKTPDGKLEDNVLADLYREYLQAGGEGKKAALRRLGDICLLITGFFSDSLKRKVVDLDYYLGMGGSAYARLASYQPGDARHVYQELATKFKPFSDVIGEMSERSGVQSNSDILRLYERWLVTGNSRLKVLLTEHGITPVKLETKTRH